jgi:hypothetical protein
MSSSTNILQEVWAKQDTNTDRKNTPQVLKTAAKVNQLGKLYDNGKPCFPCAESEENRIQMLGLHRQNLKTFS